LLGTEAGKALAYGIERFCVPHRADIIAESIHDAIVENPLVLGAVGKLLDAGEKAGFSADEMIRLLNSSLGTENLLELISRRLGGGELEPKPDTAHSSRWIV